jgi:hypothetical protein
MKKKKIFLFLVKEMKLRHITKKMSWVTNFEMMCQTKIF